MLMSYLQHLKLHCLALQVPGAFIYGVMLAGRRADLACYAAREFVALPAASLRVWRAHWARP